MIFEFHRTHTEYFLLLGAATTASAAIAAPSTAVAATATATITTPA